MVTQNSGIGLFSILIVATSILFPFIFYRSFLSKKRLFCFNTPYYNGTKTGFSFGALILLALFVLYNISLMILRFLNGDIMREIFSLLGL